MAKSYLDDVFIGKHVIAAWRGTGIISGIIYGIVWDTEDNGCVVQFQDDLLLTRYFVSWLGMEQAWDGRGNFYLSPSIKFISCTEVKPNLTLVRVQKTAQFRRNRRAVPIWSQYRS